MTIYHCNICKIEWGWSSNLPPPRVLGAQGRMCPTCHKIGIAGSFPKGRA